MNESELLGTQLGSTVVLTLNRPRRLNALGARLIAELLSVLDGLETDPSVRAVILTGSGRAFSTGADLEEVEEALIQGADVAVRDIVRPGQDLTRRIENFSKPVITAVNGLAYGGGCEIVEASHLSVAAEAASFSKAEVNLGAMPVFGGTQRLPKLVGRKRAMEMILTGRPISAQDALSYGLVNRVVSSNSLMSEALALATEVCAKSPAAVKASLQAVARSATVGLDEGLAIEAASFEHLASRPEASAGIEKFLSSRTMRKVDPLAESRVLRTEG